MSKFTNKKFASSLKHSFDGVVTTFKSQRNFKFQICILLAICFLAFYFKYSALEFALCLFTILLVLVLEMINSCIEFALDAVYKNKYSVLVKASKDICAGAVLLTSISCAIINAIILFSKIQ